MPRIPYKFQVLLVYIGPIITKVTLERTWHRGGSNDAALPVNKLGGIWGWGGGG
jgi:hypothetical protein